MKTPASKPLFYSFPEVATLKKEGNVVHVVDEYRSQLKELYGIEHPQEILSVGFSEKADAHIQSLGSLQEKGRWVFFPWINTLVHILPDEEFQKVRTARNRNLITEAEQKRFYKTCVGIAGLSIGNSIALALVLQGGARRIKLADHDTLDLSNLNRIRAGIDSLGVSKVELTARQIYLINPYSEIEIEPEGLTAETLPSFVSDLDIIVDEVDQFDAKYRLREAARMKKIPVVMATDNGNGIVLDIERYDLNPDTEFFHGRFGDLATGDLEKLEKKDTGFLIAWHVDMENIPERMWSSFNEIGKTLASWPQLAGAALLNGVVVANAIRAIANGEDVNGRSVFGLDEFLPREPVISGGVKRKPMEAREHSTSRNDGLSKIIDAALSAPSGDNIQPWKIHRTENGFTVQIDVLKDTSLYNTGGRAAYISVGTLIENATLMANRLGKALHVSEDFDGGVITCRMEMNISDASRPELAEEIFKRATNRNAFDKRPLSEDTKAFIISQGIDSDVAVKLIDAPATAFTKASSANEKLLFENEAMHHAFFDTLRWGGERWGLPVDTLALPLPGVLVFKLAKEWERFKKYNALLKFSDAIPKQTTALYDHAGGYALFTAERTDPESFYKVGRLLERVWLAATAKGLSVQPMTGIIFLHHALALDPALPLNKEERELVESSYSMIQKTAGAEHVLFAIRLGTCQKTPARAPRQSELELSF